MRLDVVGDPEIATRINAFEMAYRMQTSAPELMDLSQEPHDTFWTCTAAEPGKPSFANNCLLARRLVERGVRFVQIVSRSLGPARQSEADLKRTAKTPIRPARPWSRTSNSEDCSRTRSSIWGGEFGRTPMVQGGNDGRDHHPNRFYACGWPAAASSRASHSATTDDFGFNVVEDRVHVHDLHATILHLLGFDHTQAHLPLPRPRLPPDRRPWAAWSKNCWHKLLKGSPRPSRPFDCRRCHETVGIDRDSDQMGKLG